MNRWAKSGVLDKVFEQLQCRQLYKKRNEVETAFPPPQRLSRDLSHFEQLDVVFLGVPHFALIADVQVNGDEGRFMLTSPAFSWKLRRRFAVLAITTFSGLRFDEEGILRSRGIRFSTAGSRWVIG